jgi:hypothetical protein
VCKTKKLFLPGETTSTQAPMKQETSEMALGRNNLFPRSSTRSGALHPATRPPLRLCWLLAAVREPRRRRDGKRKEEGRSPEGPRSSPTAMEVESYVRSASNSWRRVLPPQHRPPVADGGTSPGSCFASRSEEGREGCL